MIEAEPRYLNLLGPSWLEPKWLRGKANTEWILPLV